MPRCINIYPVMENGILESMYRFMYLAGSKILSHYLFKYCFTPFSLFHLLEL